MGIRSERRLCEEGHRHNRRLCYFTARAKEGGDAVCASQANIKAGSVAPAGSNGAKDEFLMAATAQNLGKMAKLIPMPA